MQGKQILLSPPTWHLASLSLVPYLFIQKRKKKRRSSKDNTIDVGNSLMKVNFFLLPSRWPGPIFSNPNASVGRTFENLLNTYLREHQKLAQHLGLEKKSLTTWQTVLPHLFFFARMIAALQTFFELSNENFLLGYMNEVDFRTGVKRLCDVIYLL